MTLGLAIVLAAFAALAFRDLRAALLLFIGALPAYAIRLQVAGLPTTALELMFAILFFAWLFRREKRFVDVRGWRALLLGWLVVATVAVFVSPDTRAAAGAWKAYFVEPVLFFLIACDLLRTHAQRDLAVRALGATAIVLGATAIVQRFTGFGVPPPWDAPGEFRATTFFGFPNANGLLLAPIVPLLLGGLAADRKKPRLAAFWAVALLGAAAAIFLAQSEGAVIGAVAGCFAAGLLHRRFRKIAAGALVAGALAVALVAPVRDAAVEKLTLEDWSGRVRKEMWGEAFAMLKDRPLLGAGLAGYPTVFAPYHEAGHIEIFQYPHTLVLNFWSELGAAGLALFALLMARFFRDALATRAWTLAGAGVALLVHGLVDVPYFKNDLSMLFWLLMAFAASHAAEARAAPVPKTAP